MKQTDYVFQSRKRNGEPSGNMVGAQWYTDQFNKALRKVGITDYVRPFHDMRHTALTNEAATGKSNPIALMAKAGHRSMSTTRLYLHLAGTVFHDEAEALEARYNPPVAIPREGNGQPDAQYTESTEPSSKEAAQDPAQVS